ncbi:MAG: Ig-like domain-containing protein, partial [Planctomycetia bacterium]
MSLSTPNCRWSLSLWDSTGTTEVENFAINSETGVITLQEELNYEDISQYNLTIKAKPLGDTGNEFTSSLTINVTDAEDPPTVSDFVCQFGASVSFTTGLDFMSGPSSTFFEDSFSDDDGDSLSKIRIDSLPMFGILYLEGQGGAEDQMLDVNDTILSSELAYLRYLPTSAYCGSDNFNWSAAQASDIWSEDSAIAYLDVVGLRIPEDHDDHYTYDEEIKSCLAEIAGTGNLEHISIESLPTHGTIFVNGIAIASAGVTVDLTNYIAYIPDNNYNGTDSFTWSYTNNNYSFDIAVLPVNDTPVLLMLSEDVEVVQSDSPITFSLVDTTAVPYESDVYTIELTSSDEIKKAFESFDPITGQIVFNPQLVAPGSYTFSYNIIDHGNLPAGNSINITVYGATAIAPSTTPSVEEDSVTGVSFNLNGSGGSGYTYDIVRWPSNGNLTSGTAANRTYIPNSDFCGTDSFDFTVSYDVVIDGITKTVTSQPTTVEINVGHTNDVPTGQNQTVTLVAGAPVVIYLDGNDGDPEVEQEIVYNLGSLVLDNPSAGELSLADEEAGTIVFTPDETFTGSTYFTYTITETIEGVPYTSNAITVNLSVVSAPTATEKIIYVSESEYIGKTINLAGDHNQSSGTWNAGGYTILVQPEHGTLVGLDDSTGEVTYEPEPGYVGEDAFVYSLTFTEDTNGIVLAAKPAAVSLQVGALTQDQTVAMVLGESITWQLDAQELEEGQSISYTLVSSSEVNDGNLTAFDTNTGQVTYVHTWTTDGTDSFTYTYTIIDDATSTPIFTSHEIQVEIKFTDLSEVGENLYAETDEDLSIYVNLGDPSLLDLELIGMPEHGTVGPIDSSGGVVYTPDPDFTGIDFFDFTSTESGTSNTESNSFCIYVVPVNKSPTVVNSTLEIGLNDRVRIFLGTDGDSEVTQTLELTNTTLSSGTMEDFDPETGTIYYTPDSSDASFTYTLTDDDTAGGGAIANSTGSISFVLKSNIVVASPLETVHVSEDGSIYIQILGEDDDGSGIANFTMLTEPEHGTWTWTGLDALGRLRYEPDPNYNGTDTFCYSIAGDGTTSIPITVDIVIDAVYDAPVATSPTVTATQDIPLRLVLGSDDGSRTDLTLTIQTPPTQGSYEVFGDIVYYTPNAASGTDTFTYTLEDEGGTSNVGTVSINLTSDGTAFVACPISGETLEDESIVLTPNVIGGMADTDHFVMYEITVEPEHGKIVQEMAAGGEPGTINYVLRYIPDENYNGPDSFEYRAYYAEIVDTGTGEEIQIVPGTGEIETYSDAGVVDIYVTPVEDAPYANTLDLYVPLDGAIRLTLGDGGDPEKEQTLMLQLIMPPGTGTVFDFDPATGEVTYMPGGSAGTTDTFEYRLIDITDPDQIFISEAATTTIHLMARPTAVADSSTTSEDTGCSISLTGTPIAAAPEITTEIIYVITAYPEHGTIENFDETTGDLTYTPDENYYGEDSFNFNVIQSYGTDEGVYAAIESHEATFSLTVTEVDDAPVANTLSVSTQHGVPVTFFLSGTDIDLTEESNLVFMHDTSSWSGHGIVTIDSTTGEVTYEPDATYYPVVTFEFYVYDSSKPTNHSANAAVTINIGHAPTAVDDFPITVEEDSTETDATNTFYLTGDGPCTDETLTYAIVSPPSHGTIVDIDASTGKVTYVPDPNYANASSGAIMEGFAADEFQYVIIDSNNENAPGIELVSAPITVSLRVNSVNDSPELISYDGIELTVLRGESIRLVLGNDGDTELVQTLINSSWAENGTLSDFDPTTGKITYTHNGNNVDADIIHVMLGDGALSTSGTITINIKAANHVPVADPQNVTSIYEDSSDNLIALTGSDGENDFVQALTYVIVTSPQHGTIDSFNPVTGEVRYTPDPDYYGEDSFSFLV